ncbi:phosphatidylinositol N-acetylglucosaminyltransferase subunit C [Suillus subaureus]|uniref:Phosphatidylinositol N-acetylglucosaminyltransferase subunit C n=1 Tax=Suillus subaureus TaxID=48587 RepID=A0A9P7JJ29_9AGAM|nr:phosphatidylinositol N-acetylglucosaminyltransferase subunit C [Suillus subaureus]KAG1825953.1 phosphatidylinositol N-acetylglucosaminyltransferase subunit C [Suillus subaureus]
MSSEAEGWNKVLWERQPFPDNYIHPHSFLSSLRRNPNFKPYTYWPLVLLCCAITQHLATIFTFLAVFVRLKERWFDARVLLWVSIASFFGGYALYEILSCSNPVRGAFTRSNTIKSSLLVFLALMGLSPVLRTLTAATSSDSIWALSACLFLLNALLADYSSMKPRHIDPAVNSHLPCRLTSVLSMNAAISSSVVLASRLPDDLAVFVLVLFAVQLFALFPILRHRLQVTPQVAQILFTLTLCILSFALTVPLSVSVAYIYAGISITVTFVAPGVLVWAAEIQKARHFIRGPWDVAVPRLN